MILPIFFTHVVPALVVFSPEVFALGAPMWLLFRFTAVDESGQSMISSMREHFRTHVVDVKSFTCMANSGGLIFLPILVGTTIIAEILVYQAVYLYHGDGWSGSILEALTERQAGIYINNFKLKVLGAWWSCADVVNE